MTDEQLNESRFFPYFVLRRNLSKTEFNKKPGSPKGGKAFIAGEPQSGNPSAKATRIEEVEYFSKSGTRIQTLPEIERIEQ